MVRKTGLIIALLIALAGAAAQAQTGGQFCVRAFEDRNGSGTFESGEPLLTSGVSVDLLNAENLVVASALLSESPTAAQGVICFQFLAPGQYSLVITSPDYAPTTPNTVSAAISEGTLPTVVEFGGQRLALLEADSAAPQQGFTLPFEFNRSLLPRLVLAFLGSLVMMALMIILGSVIYLLVFRGTPQPTYGPPPTTGGTKPVGNQPR
jgi:hypothetical protein